MFRKLSLLCMLFVAGQGVTAQPSEIGMGRVNSMEEACKDKSAGDDCTAIQPGNRTVSGECFSGAPAEAEHAPPLHCRMMHPAELACKKLSEDDDCKFSRPGDASESVDGKCATTPHGSLTCRPSGGSHGGPGGGPGEAPDNDGFLPPHLACKNLTAGDECKTRGPDDGLGICTRIGRGGPDGDNQDSNAPIHCRSLPPMEKACYGKSANDACTMTRGGIGSVNGTCGESKHGDMQFLACQINHGGRVRLDSLTEDQQKELNTKMQRVREIRSDPSLPDSEDLQNELKTIRSDVQNLRGRGGGQA